MLYRYGAFISGTASGSRKEAPGDSPLSGLRAQATFDLGLAELLQQPVFKGSASVLAGQAKLALEIDGGAEYPAQLQASITGLRARACVSWRRVRARVPALYRPPSRLAGAMPLYV